MGSGSGGGAFDPPARLVIADLPRLRAISDPVRMRILEELCDRERSVSEIAEILATTRHRLYYHVRILERLGLVRETSRRKVSGTVERLYRASARSFVISDEIAPSVLSSTIANVFGQTLREVEAGVQRQRGRGRREDPQVGVIRGMAVLEPSKHREFAARIKALVEEFESSGDTSDPEARRYGLLIAMAPALEDADEGRAHRADT